MGNSILGKFNDDFISDLKVIMVTGLSQKNDYFLLETGYLIILKASRLIPDR